MGSAPRDDLELAPMQASIGGLDLTLITAPG